MSTRIPEKKLYVWESDWLERQGRGDGGLLPAQRPNTVSGLAHPSIRTNILRLTDNNLWESISSADRQLPLAHQTAPEPYRKAPPISCYHLSDPLPPMYFKLALIYAFLCSVKL